MQENKENIHKGGRLKNEVIKIDQNSHVPDSTDASSHQESVSPFLTISPLMCSQSNKLKDLATEFLSTDLDQGEKVKLQCNQQIDLAAENELQRLIDKFRTCQLNRSSLPHSLRLGTFNPDY